MLRVSFWAFRYIYCLLSKTGPNGCIETRGTRTREVARKSRQDFSIQKGSIFPPCGWVWSHIKGKKVGPFAALRRGHVAIIFRKEKEKEKKIFFYKKPNSSLSSFSTFQKLLPLFHVAFLLPPSPPLLSIKAPKSLSISTPNCKGKPFSESWSTPLHCGTSNFSYGWTSFHMKFVGIGFLGAMMGSSTRFLP